MRRRRTQPRATRGGSPRPALGKRSVRAAAHDRFAQLDVVGLTIALATKRSWARAVARRPGLGRSLRSERGRRRTDPPALESAVARPSLSVAAARLRRRAASGRACGRLSGGELQVGDGSLALDDDSSESRWAVISPGLVRGAVRVRGRRRRSRVATSGLGDRRARRRPPSRVARCRSPARVPRAARVRRTRASPVRCA
jgi:hypothetical protein